MNLDTWTTRLTITVDDCSGDGTLAAPNKIQALYPQGWIRVIASTENGGAGTARNIGCAAAKQVYIALLDFDDSWHPQKIEIQYSWMIKHPDATSTGHAWHQVDDEGVDKGQVDFSVVDPEFYIVSKNQLLLSNRFSTPSVMLRRDIGQRSAGGKRYSGDFQLWLEIYFTELVCYRTELPLANLHKLAYGVAGLTAMSWNMEKRQLDSDKGIYRIKKISLNQLTVLYTWYFLKYFRWALKTSMRKVVENLW